ncbi:hypothetical protein L3X38_018190 [Prunus dulcis]|uniref:Uncharacterized protein n=1 Tax=Prunus dulcis TaxID=3755 RepID=A0AAD4ZBE7_PRUDU|nr:hypothetical protein L3X38_018190 [Prunus dulcis]
MDTQGCLHNRCCLLNKSCLRINLLPSDMTMSTDILVAFGFVSVLDICPTSVGHTWTVGARNADQVDQISYESIEDCGSGDFVLPEVCEDVSLWWPEELTKNKGIDGN